jgi:hypothetical protein
MVALVLSLAACGGSSGAPAGDFDTPFEPPPSFGSFFGRVTEVEFGDTWQLHPADTALSTGPAAGTRLGPATLTFDDGSVLFMPEGTPGGNNCRQLLSEAEWPGITGFANPTPEQKQRNGPTQDCWLYGGLDPAGNVSWFGIGSHGSGDSVVSLPEITAIRDGYATIAGVVELPLIPDDRSLTVRLGGRDLEVPADKHVGCGKDGMTFADWWPSDQSHSTWVDVATREVVAVACRYSI